MDTNEFIKSWADRVGKTFVSRRPLRHSDEWPLMKCHRVVLEVCRIEGKLSICAKTVYAVRAEDPNHESLSSDHDPIHLTWSDSERPLLGVYL